jgi:hypothetical protein
MSENEGPNTRELINQAEALRSDRKGKVPKTRQLVREAETLIGRDGEARGGSRAWVLLLLLFLALVGGGALLYLLTRG